MSEQLLEDALKHLPHTDEARRRVIEWMRSSDVDPERDASDPSDREESVHDDDYQPDQVGVQRKVSIIGANVESSTKRGSTASQGGPMNRNEGSTASQGGPATSKKGSTASQGGPVTSKKGLTASQGGPAPTGGDHHSGSEDGSQAGKRRRSSSDSCSSEESEPIKRPRSGPTVAYFDPASLVQSKEGTCKVSSQMRKYLNQHMKRCLSKEERDALFKEHPRPDLDSCTPPKVDKFMSEFLGRRLPKDHEMELTKIQSAILASIRPLTSAWQHLMEGGLEEDPDMVVPGSEVLALVQRTLCMIGNASELVSQTRRSKILETVEPSWSKFGSDDFPSAKDTLFGEEFQSSLTTRVEKDTALSKAVAITRRSKKEKEAPAFSGRKEGQRGGPFFRGGPPAKYGGRQGKSFFPYSAQFHQSREGEYSRGRRYFNPHRQGQKPLYHEPRLPPGQSQKTPQRKF